MLSPAVHAPCPEAGEAWHVLETTTCSLTRQSRRTKDPIRKDLHHIIHIQKNATQNLSEVAIPFKYQDMQV